MRYVALASSLLTGLAVATIAALAAAPGVINQYNAVCNPDFPKQCITVDSNGAIAVTGAGGGAGGTATLKATAAPPTYVEGSTTNPLSSDLSGFMRTLAAAKATASPPLYVEGIDNPLSMDLGGALRVSGQFTSTLKATAADPSYGEGTTNPASGDLSGYFRTRVKAVAGSYAAGAFVVGSALDGWDATQGTKADARSTATDTTPATVMSVLKELSFLGQNPVQQPVTQIGSPWGVTISGNVPVTQITSPWNISGAVTQSGAWNVGQTGAPWSVTGSGAAGTPATGVETVQGIAGGTPVPVSGTVAVTQSGAPWSVTITPVGIAPVVSTALETGHVLKAGAGDLYGVEVTTSGVAGYLLIFNSTTVPAAGAVSPVAHCYALAFATCAIDFDPPLALSTGISVAFSVSTTPFTKTDSATAAFSGQVQ